MIRLVKRFLICRRRGHMPMPPFKRGSQGSINEFCGRCGINMLEHWR